MIKLRNSALYLKFYKSKHIKIANNIHIYDYITDDLGHIHIAYIDYKKRVVYALWKNGVLTKKTLYNIINDKKNLLSITINIFNDSLNIFIVESSILNLSNMIHLYYDINRNILLDYRFDNLNFNSFSCSQSYLNPNLLILSLNTTIESNDSKLIFRFDTNYKSWSSLNEYNINQDLINYCKSLNYK